MRQNNTVNATKQEIKPPFDLIDLSHSIVYALNNDFVMQLGTALGSLLHTHTKKKSKEVVHETRIFSINLDCKTRNTYLQFDWKSFIFCCSSNY